MSEQNSTQPVAKPSADYLAMVPDWNLVDALMGGTDSMRSAGKAYLPQFSLEENDAYAARLNSSFLHNFFRKAVNDISSKPFKKAVTVTGKLPEPLDQFDKNVDQANTTLTQFAKNVFKNGVAKGIAYVYIDMPVNPDRRIDTGIRPYFSFYPASSLLGAKFERSKKTGELRLSMIRLKETRTEDTEDGYGEQIVQVIRVVKAPEFDDEDRVVDGKKGTVELWEKRPGENEYTAQTPVVHDYPGIPFEPFDPGKEGRFFASPPLRDLAFTNVEHWQSRSDQRCILHFARVFQVVVTGANEDDQKTIGKFGPDNIWFLQDPDANAKILEHGGAAIEAGAKDINEIEQRARGLAGDPLVRKSGFETATGRAIDEGHSQSQAASWAEELGFLLERCYRHAAKWLDLELPEDFKINVFTDFSLTARRDEDLKHLLALRTTGNLDQESLLTEFKRRGVLSEDAKVEDLMEAIKNEGPMGFDIADEGEGDGDEDE